MKEITASNIKNLNFHIKSGDYFGTLATVLSLVHESERMNMKTVNSDILKKAINDLMFLQAKYKIVKSALIKN